MPTGTVSLAVAFGTARIVCVALALCACFSESGATGFDHGRAILVQLPGATINRSEFEVGYQAWRDRYPGETLPADDYLDLLIRLRQLALVARDSGLHRTSEFELWLSRFIAQARDSGLLQRDIANWKLREAYDRQQYLLQASQILKLSPATESDTEPAALREIRRIRARLLAGEATFDALARLESDDPSVQENGGDLGYFTVFETIYPLESAAYETPHDELSSPVRSRFGYHLVKVTGGQRIGGLKRASHILIRAGTPDARSMIERIYRQVTPDRFAELAQEFSQDYRTSVNGGDLGTDRLLDALEAVRLALPVGAHSAPFRSSLGWHILRVTELQPFPEFTRMRPLLRRKLELDDRVQREVERILQAPSAASVDSPVVEAYRDDLLCRMLLSNSGVVSQLDLMHRTDLIDWLRRLDLPPDLDRRAASFPAVIDAGIFDLIDI